MNIQYLLFNMPLSLDIYDPLTKSPECDSFGVSSPTAHAGQDR